MTKTFYDFDLCLKGIQENQWNFDICDILLRLRRKEVC
jgi:hypothetical protein